jgi:hypothetical protein
VNVRKLTVFLKREVIQGFEYVRLEFGKMGQFINLTEKSLDIKTALKKWTSGHPV